MVCLRNTVITVFISFRYTESMNCLKPVSLHLSITFVGPESRNSNYIQAVQGHSKDVPYKLPHLYENPLFRNKIQKIVEERYRQQKLFGHREKVFRTVFIDNNYSSADAMTVDLFFLNFEENRFI